MSESVRVFVPYPLPDPLEVEMFIAAAQPGYNGPTPIAVRDFNYYQDLRAVMAALSKLGLDSPERPKPEKKGDERCFALTVKLRTGVTAEAIRDALPSFEIEG